MTITLVRVPENSDVRGSCAVCRKCRPRSATGVSGGFHGRSVRGGRRRLIATRPSLAHLPPPPPPPPPPPAFPLVVAPAASFESAEYFGTGFTSSNRSGLGQLHASTAYSLGATGQGITVAVIDTNVDASISELRGQVIGSHDVRASTRNSTDIDTDGHGTMVASVIAALKNGTGAHGVA